MIHRVRRAALAGLWGVVLVALCAGSGAAGEKAAPAEAGGAKGLAVQRAPDDRYIEITDGPAPVVRYLFRTVPVPKGVGGRYAVARSDYIHPLYGPAGEVLTKDYSPDHPHHRGLYWAWPEVTYKGKTHDLHALQGVFARPEKILKAEADAKGATISAANIWKWEDNEPIVREVATIHVHPRQGAGRAIDLTFAFTALVDGVTVARRGRSHYGGFNLRFSARTGQKILPHTDPATAKPRRAWGQLVGTPPGGTGPVSVTTLQHPGNPHYPGDWQAYPNLNWLQPTFPRKGTRYPLTQGKPLVLKFRLWIQAGQADDKTLAAQWDEFTRSG